MTAAVYANSHCNAAAQSAYRSASCCANTSATCRFFATDAACAVSVFVYAILWIISIMIDMSMLVAALLVRLCRIISVRLHIILPLHRLNTAFPAV